MIVATAAVNASGFFGAATSAYTAERGDRTPNAEVVHPERSLSYT